MAVFDNLHKTSSSGLAPSVIEQYYERTLLKDKEADLMNGRDMTRKSLPAHSGKRVQFRIANGWAPITDPLKEGVTPSAQMLTMTDRTITIRPYGKYVELTDEVQWAILDNAHKMLAENLRRQALESVDAVCADAWHSGLNVQYVDASGSNTSRSAITASDILKFSDIKKAVRTLEKNNAPKFPDGYYHALIDPDTKYDLTADDKFLNVAQYQDKGKVEKYELGTIYGVKFYESTQTKKFASTTYLYDSVTELALTAGSSATKQFKIATSTVSSDAAEIEHYIRRMTNRLVEIYDASATACIPCYIDRIANDGTSLVHTLRFVGSAWTFANGDKLYPPSCGASNYSVHSTVIYGQGAAGCVELEGNGKNVSIIAKPCGSSGALDPLNQRGTIAWKIRGFGAGILHDNYVVRLEHGVSA